MALNRKWSFKLLWKEYNASFLENISEKLEIITRNEEKGAIL